MPENTQSQKVKEITDRLEAGIQELFNSEQYRTWLRTMSKFHSYSLNNTLLIAFQGAEGGEGDQDPGPDTLQEEAGDGEAG